LTSLVLHFSETSATVVDQVRETFDQNRTHLLDGSTDLRLSS
jgi:uncharacterized membrane-anchored protein YhcB (DUF1043 family)